MSILELFKSKGVGSAVAESILIMFGVLAALAVQSWWDDRVEQEELLSHLTAVQDELHEAQEAISTDIRQAGQVVDRTRTVLLMLADTQTDAMPNSFINSIGKMYAAAGPDIPLSAFDAFVSSGSLRLIKDRALRGKFAEYRNEIHDVEGAGRTVMNVYYDVQVPFLNKYFIVSDFGWEIIADDAFGERILSYGEVPKAPYTINWDAIRSLEFWNLVFDWRIAHGDLIFALNRAQISGQQLQDQLRAEIEELER